MASSSTSQLSVFYIQDSHGQKNKKAIPAQVVKPNIRGERKERRQKEEHKGRVRLSRVPAWGCCVQGSLGFGFMWRVEDVASLGVQCSSLWFRV